MTVASKLLMGSGGVDLPSDDEFDNVSFLSHFDGSNNGTNIVYDDGSDSNHTISVTGTPSQGTFGPFARVDGEWSNYFDGSSNYLEIASTSDFNFGTGDFTWEWFFFGAPSGSYPIFYSQTGADFGVYYNVSDGKLYYDNAAISDTDMGTLPLNSWNHIAVSRVSGTSNLYLNGTRTATVSDGQDYATGTARIANYRTGSGSSYPMKGYISNLRIIKGTGLYSASSITVPTSALTAISGTVLLTCQSNRFKDNSASAHAITVAGTPKVKAFTPILTSEVYDSAVNGAGAYFDGTDGYLSAADSSDWDLGSGSYTVEAWVWAGAGVTASTFNNIVGQWPQTGAPSTNSWLMENSGGVVVGYAVISGTATLVAQSATLPLAQWVHVALVRNGNAHNIYINGVAGATTTNTNAYDAGSGAVEVGGFSHSSLAAGNWDGYISNVRVVKGTAVYTSNFTPPTAPLTAITNTKLLLNMADGQAIDSAAQNNMTLINGADTSTTEQKFGTASLDLTASNAFVTFPASSADFGAGNFTIECWAYRSTSATTHNCLLSMDGGGVQFYVYNNSLDFYAHNSSGGYIVSGVTGPASSISADTWYHVAAVRNGTAFTCYVDGVGGTPVTGSGALGASTGSAAIGTYIPGTDNLFFVGYIDDFRISHFARYTSNFTPTTEAFPDKGQ